ncbi:FUN14 domain-containing protein [Deinococcus pimensis]|uniref:FUN14 domain-containing protein n=1 Tax=Deinococcus pimensis TaxID=309888 RepID=UPI00048A3196|nr:FUN14 domain-containing protein [Deinococcus pimensis]
MTSLGDLLTPILPDLSLGGLLGFCAGFAVKKVGRGLIFVLGALFVVLQLLAWWGFVTVNWTHVREVAEPLVRQGGEQGGAWLMKVLTANLPFGGAFTAGLLLGLRTK